MRTTFCLIAAILLASSAGCESSTPMAPMTPTTPLTEEQQIQIQNEDERVAFEESQGSIRPSSK